VFLHNSYKPKAYSDAGDIHFEALTMEHDISQNSEAHVELWMVATIDNDHVVIACV
jgi:hypothetical protein